MRGGTSSGQFAIIAAERLRIMLLMKYMIHDTPVNDV